MADDHRYAVWCKVPKEPPSQSDRESWENSSVLRRFITTRGFHVEVFDAFIAQHPTTKRPVTMFDLRNVTSLRQAGPAARAAHSPSPPLAAALRASLLPLPYPTGERRAGRAQARAQPRHDCAVARRRADHRQ